jgi:hypothetical protein
MKFFYEILFSFTSVTNPYSKGTRCLTKDNTLQSSYIIFSMILLLLGLGNHSAPKYRGTFSSPSLNRPS